MSVTKMTTRARRQQFDREVEAGIAAGRKPATVITEASQEYGLPSPKWADELARKYRVIVPGSDGYLHDGVERDEEAIVEHQRRVVGLKNQLKFIVSLPSPKELLAEIEDFMLPAIDEHLDAAVDWLTSFQEARHA